MHLTRLTSWYASIGQSDETPTAPLQEDLKCRRVGPVSLNDLQEKDFMIIKNTVFTFIH